MDATSARALIEGGESFTVEFKAGSINASELLEAVVCLANGSGGYLFVGVNDDGAVLGARPLHGRTTDPNRLAAFIANKTDPAVVAEVDVLDLDGKEVIAVTVPASHDVVGTTEGKYIRRAIGVHGEPQCLPMRPNEILARAGSTGAQDYARIPLAELAMTDLSELEFARLRELATDGGDSPLGDLSNEELLKALGLMAPSGAVTVGALLLFGREEALARYVPTHEVAFQELDNLEVRTNIIRRTPLLQAMVELVDLVQVRNREEEIDVGALFRVGLPRFAAVAVRELVANALVHRDYSTIGTVLVQLDGDALTVSNPGGFPEGVTIQSFLTAPPRPRNPLVADAFKRAGLVERTGRGVNRVFYSQLSLGRPAPDYGRSTPTSVVARLPAGPADKELAAFIAEMRKSGESFSLQDLQALHEVRQERRITSASAADLFQISISEARAELNRLVERGLLEARGERKGRSYHLSASVYRRMGEATNYVRTRGFDDIQQEQMVLAYVDRHGSITRQDAADLCQLDSEQASRLLRRLRDQRKLQLVGERRAARYVRPG